MIFNSSKLFKIFLYERLIPLKESDMFLFSFGELISHAFQNKSEDMRLKSSINECIKYKTAGLVHKMLGREQ